MKNKSYIEGRREVFQDISNLPKDEVLIMLNFLKYKQVENEKGFSGRVLYQQYLKAATPFIKKAAAELIFFGSPKMMLIGPEDEALWDDVLVVKYNTPESFLNMIQAKDYPSELRAEALEDSRLIYCNSQFIK